jgi:hypothetical protein
MIPDGTPAPPDEPHRYVPVARPGSRAPHCWLGEGDALYDRFGVGFTLLDFAPPSNRTTDLRNAFDRKKVPLKVLRIEGGQARDIYGCDYVLVGPDQHVCWRANSPPSDPDRLVEIVRGARLSG